MPKILLCESIAERLVSDYGGVSSLPSERELASRYVCNRRTIRSAISILIKKGLVDSLPRSGHYFRSPVSPPETVVSLCSEASHPCILMLSMCDSLLDVAHLSMIGGAIQQAEAYGMSLFNRAITPDFLSHMSSYEDLGGGIEPDGYFIAGLAPLALHELIQKSMKPCVMLGRFHEEHIDGRSVRCKQIVTNLSALYKDLGESLASLGHRRVLCAAPWAGHGSSEDNHEIYRALRHGLGKNVHLDLFTDWPSGTLTEGFEHRLAIETVNRLDGHTVIVAPNGHVFGLHLLLELTRHGLTWPDKLSVIGSEAETDWYFSSMGVSAVQSNGREQGEYCIRELAHQIQTGQLEYGFGYTPLRYIDRGSVGRV